MGSPLVAGSVMIVYGTLPSCTASSTPVTVTVCGAFQLAVVNVTLAGLTVPSAVLLLRSGMTTVLVPDGCELRTMVNVAVFGVFLTLEATEIILFIGNFAGNSGIVKVGGYVGVVTALVAWYASAAGVANAMAERPVVAVGRPLWDLSGGLTRPGGPIPRMGTTGGPSEAH